MHFTPEEIQYLISVIANLRFQPGQSQQMAMAEQMINKLNNIPKSPPKVPIAKEEGKVEKKTEKKKTA